MLPTWRRLKPVVSATLHGENRNLSLATLHLEDGNQLSTTLQWKRWKPMVYYMEKIETIGQLHCLIKMETSCQLKCMEKIETSCQLHCIWQDVNQLLTTWRRNHWPASLRRRKTLVSCIKWRKLRPWVSYIA